MRVFSNKLLLIILISLPIHARLLDKVAAVINNRVITISEVDRIKKTITARKEISPLIYEQNQNYNADEIIKIIWKSFIIRDKISSLGYVISDDSVESRIQMTEKRLGLRRDDLLDFLKSKNISFTEYFELTRESMEYNIFTSKVINPLVSITDQEIKNTFYKSAKNTKTLSFKFHLIDYYIDASVVSNTEEFKNVVSSYYNTGILPEKFSNLEKVDLGEIKEDGLNSNLKSLIKTTDEGNFTKPTKMADVMHIFFVKKKDLTESTAFLKNRDNIKNMLFLKKSKKIIQTWFDNEFNNYYTKITL